VVSQFGGLSAPDAFRSFSVLTLLQGVTVLITVCILSLLL
jgi:H+/gluconate symporter-like permease